MPRKLKDTKELVTARTAFQNSVTAVLDAIKKRYLQQLDARKKQLEGRGDAKGATALLLEMEKITSAKSGDPISQIPADTPVRDIKNIEVSVDSNMAESLTLKDAYRIVRLVIEFPDRIFDLKDGRLPDELKVDAVRGGFRISGKKVTDSVKIEDKLAGHFGKGVVFPVRACKGQIDPVIPRKDKDIRYFIVSTTAGDKSMVKEIFPKEKSAWTIPKVKDCWQFQIGDQVIPFPDKTTKVGFGASVRNPGSVTDLIITFDDALKNK